MKSTASEGLALFRAAARTRHAHPSAGRPTALEEFEQVYRANVALISAYSRVAARSRRRSLI
jgi:hypothetical protein